MHNAPSLTIEAKWNRPVRVKWINDLKDAAGDYLPHLLPVDPTLHWANPPGGTEGRDMRPEFTVTPDRYTGPVPIVTHVHGAVGVADDSDGYAEAWYLPTTRPDLTGYSPRTIWTSVPQIVVAVILTTASPGPGTGFGTSSTPMTPLPRNTTAFIVFICRSFRPSPLR